MIISKLRLENFGLFSGKQEIDLSPNRDKKIIIIGGKNGNGKTTLFEAIKLCLYGQRAVNHRYNKKFYERYLTERIHHNPHGKQQAVFAGVGLEFQHAHLGKIDNYYVQRYWENNGSGFQESFVVKRNDKDLDLVGSDQWQEFINDIIPPGLSQLFFFDGERIQALAEDEEDSKQLSESFKALLGVDLVEKLRSDLEIYSLRQIKQEGARDLKMEIDQLQKEKEQLKAEQDALLQEKAHIKSRIDQTLKNIEDQERAIAKEGGVFAQKREELRKNKILAEYDIQNVEERLKEFCSDILPFIFAPTLSARLKKSLLAEEEYRNTKITKENIQNKVKGFKKELIKKEFWKETSLKDREIESIARRILECLQSSLQGRVTVSPVHNLSSNEHHRLLSYIDRVNKEGPQKFKNLNNQYETLTKKLHHISRELELAPEDSIISEEVAAVNKLHNQLGGFEQQLHAKDEELKSYAYRLQKNDRDLRNLVEEFHNKQDLSERLQLVKRVQVAMQEYHKELERKKIQEFSDIFIDSYNQIARKKEVFKKIEIDPKNYAVTLYKSDGKSIPKSQLSAGEKQIYAIAILWALTKISGRPLPFIIDTPMGRLDSEHRNKLVHNFFPESSHQLIILSTDTEIDHEYLSTLAPHTIRTFNLDYRNGETRITDGYFWDEK